jgi:hypothetical protein
VTASRLHGAPWSFTSLPYTVPTSQAANLNVFTNLTPFTVEVRVAYDNFRINSGSITCPTWWDDSSPDWQAISKGRDARPIAREGSLERVALLRPHESVRSWSEWAVQSTRCPSTHGQLDRTRNYRKDIRLGGQ